MPQPTETEIAKGFLKVQRDLELDSRLLNETAIRGRKRTVDLARRYGLEWEEIGEHLSLSGEAIRKWYERHEGI